jgi:hypothetical protein
MVYALILLRHLGLQGGALDGPETQEAPAGGGHVFDESALDFVFGGAVALEGGE